MAGRKKFNRFQVPTPNPAQIARYALVYRAEDLYHRADTVQPLSSEAVFGNSKPLILDLGSGRGEFIVGQAQAEPDKNFVGIDLHWKSIYDSINKVSKLALTNLKFVRADLRWILNIVPDLSVEAAFLLFPAPVMKMRYLRKDVLTAPFLCQLHRVLISGGHFHFVTDSEAYFAKKQQLVEHSNLFILQEQRASYEGGHTRYQQYWESFGIQSWRAEYLKEAE